MILTARKTNAEVIDEILGKLIEQGGQCIANGECVYGNNDMHCAVGWLLPPDNEAVMTLLGGVYDLLNSFSGRLGPNEGFVKNNATLLVNLQNFHDADCVDFLNTAHKDLPPYAHKLTNVIAWKKLRTRQLEEHNNAI